MLSQFIDNLFFSPSLCFSSQLMSRGSANNKDFEAHFADRLAKKNVADDDLQVERERERIFVFALGNQPSFSFALVSLCSSQSFFDDMLRNVKNPTSFPVM